MKKFIQTKQWDASLDTSICNSKRNSQLTINMRIAFKQINPPSGQQSGTYHDFGISSKPGRKI